MEARYRKKPIVVTAHHVTNLYDAVKWIRSRGGSGYVSQDSVLARPVASSWLANQPLYDMIGEEYGVVETVEGEMRFRVGDYLIQGVRGELYPCLGSIFEETYESVDGEDEFIDSTTKTRIRLQPSNVSMHERNT